MWAALLIAGTMAILRFLTDSADRKGDLLVAAILCGGAMAAKAVISIHLPMLAIPLLLTSRHWFQVELARTMVLAVSIFALLGAIPYATAYRVTGNPVFPFFKGYFKSPLHPPVNFQPPAIFDRGFRLETLFDMTFHSNRFLEATTGAAGFQWRLLVVPGVVVILLLRQRRALLIALLCLGWFMLTF